MQLPKGRDVEDDDSFVFNEGFTAPLYRIKVNPVVHLVAKILIKTSGERRLTSIRMKHKTEILFPCFSKFNHLIHTTA